MALKESNPAIYQDLMRRLKRIEGQARGVQRLLEEGADCQDLVIQLAAMTAALKQVGLRAATCQLSERMAEEIRAGGTGHSATEEMLETFLRL